MKYADFVTKLLTLLLIVQSPVYFSLLFLKQYYLMSCLFNVSDDNMVSKLFYQVLYNIAGVSLSIYFQASTHLLK